MLPGVLPVVLVPRVERRDAGVFAAADDARAELAFLTRPLEAFAGREISEGIAASSSSESPSGSAASLAAVFLEACETVREDDFDALDVGRFVVDLLRVFPA